MASSVPFNPMRKTPPPPPHIDTVGIDPTEYISVFSKEGHECVVHRNCLRESPLIRRTFEKGVSVSNDFFDILFAAPPQADSATPKDLPQPMEAAAERATPSEAEGKHDHRVRIVFHSLTAVMLEMVLAYLYQKCYFEQTRIAPKNELEIPTSCACEILKVATALEC